MEVELLKEIVGLLESINSASCFIAGILIGIIIILAFLSWKK